MYKAQSSQSIKELVLYHMADKQVHCKIDLIARARDYETLSEAPRYLMFDFSIGSWGPVI